MSRNLILILNFSFFILLASPHPYPSSWDELQNNEGWELVKETDRVLVYSKLLPNSPIPALKAEILSDVKMEKLADAAWLVEKSTVVFPNAEHKFFLVADIHERARRRKKEMEANGEVVSLEELTSEMEERDRKDTTRRHSPLKKAEDAVKIDTTGLSIAEQVNRIVKIVNKSIK